MATTSTYDYNPATSNLLLTALGRALIRREMITTQVLADAQNEINLLQSSWSNVQPMLWTDELYSVTLSPGQQSITLPARLIAIQSAYLTTQYNGSDASQDRIIWALSNFEYSAVPNKTQQGAPTSYWMNRQVQPEIFFWPVPDASATYIFNTRIVSQIQDASLPGGSNLNLPFRFLDAWVAEMAARMAAIYPDPIVKAFGPGGVANLEMKAKAAFDRAITQDSENVPLFIGPGDGMSAYFR